MNLSSNKKPAINRSLILVMRLVIKICLTIFVFSIQVFSVQAGQKSSDNSLRFYDYRTVTDAALVQGIAEQGSYNSVVVISYGNDQKTSLYMEVAQNLYSKGAPVNAVIQTLKNQVYDGSATIYCNGGLFASVKNPLALADKIVECRCILEENWRKAALLKSNSSSREALHEIVVVYFGNDRDEMKSYLDVAVDFRLKGATLAFVPGAGETDEGNARSKGSESIEIGPASADGTRLVKAVATVNKRVRVD